MRSLKYLALFFLFQLAIKGRACFAQIVTNSQETPIILSGSVIEGRTGKPIPFVNIGIVEKNIGTLSDPDGSFELTIPAQYVHDSVIFSSLGFNKRIIP